MKKIIIKESLNPVTMDFSLCFFKKNLKGKLFAFLFLLSFFNTQANAIANSSKYELCVINTISENLNVPVELTPKLQQLEIKGHISSALDNSPLPGATILEKGTNNGIITDFDGNFTLKVTNKDAILVISYIGYTTQEVSIKGKTKLEIVMDEEADSLDEVVVVGFGSQKKIPHRFFV